MAGSPRESVGRGYSKGKSITDLWEHLIPPKKRGLRSFIQGYEFGRTPNDTNLPFIFDSTLDALRKAPNNEAVYTEQPLSR